MLRIQSWWTQPSPALGGSSDGLPGVGVGIRCGQLVGRAESCSESLTWSCMVTPDSLERLSQCKIREIGGESKVLGWANKKGCPSLLKDSCGPQRVVRTGARRAQKSAVSGSKAPLAREALLACLGHRRRNSQS